MRKPSHWLKLSGSKCTKPTIAKKDTLTMRSARLEKEVAARGVVDVFRHGIKHQKYSIESDFPYRGGRWQAINNRLGVLREGPHGRLSNNYRCIYDTKSKKKLQKRF
jgi:hypothetical protein